MQDPSGNPTISFAAERCDEFRSARCPLAADVIVASHFGSGREEGSVNAGFLLVPDNAPLSLSLSLAGKLWIAVPANEWIKNENS